MRLYMYEILLSHRKEGNPAVCDDSDGMRGPYAEMSRAERDKDRMTHSRVEPENVEPVKTAGGGFQGRGRGRGI